MNLHATAPDRRNLTHGLSSAMGR